MRYDAAKTTEPAGRALIIAGPADYNGALDAVIANLRRYLGPPPGLCYENPGAEDRDQPLSHCRRHRGIVPEIPATPADLD